MPEHLTQSSGAGQGPVKRVFELERFTTRSGRVLQDVKVGYESHGTLDAERSNAILVCHFFSGTSHAAGRYRPGDALPGYWDAIIGPGKAIDTERYFVLSSDTLVNLNAYDPTVTTTGPASIDPDTGVPYAMTFPIVTIGDFVDVQRRLVESLGIRRLAMVCGPSMGALQTFEWAARHPDMVQRIMPVIGQAEADAHLIAWLDMWSAPIRLDPAWRGGDYYGREPPRAGLELALKLVTLHARHWRWADTTFGREWARSGADPAADFENRFAIEVALGQLATLRAETVDANHLLYLAKACQLFVAGGGGLADGLSRIKAPALVITSPGDQVFPPDGIARTVAGLRAGGTPVEHMLVEGGNGHFDGLLSIQDAERAIRGFLA